MKGKYRPRYAKELRDGLRKDGLIIEECCLRWGVSRQSYYDWIKNNPKFAEAAEIGEMHYRAYFANKFREKMNGDARAPGNAGMLIFAAKNVMGWADKVETHTTHDEEVKTLNINILPSRELPQLKQGNIIDFPSLDEQ